MSTVDAVTKENNMITEVVTKEDLTKAMKAINALLAIGSAGMTDEDKQELLRLSVLVEEYEDIHHPMPLPPSSLPEMIRLKMYEQRLKQKDMATLLDISETRLSEVLSGKRKVNIDLAKRLYGQLRIEPAFILEKA